MTLSQPTKLKVIHEKYMGKIPAHRKTKFNCPSCNNEIQTLKPEDGDVWDSASSCPDCEAIFFKVVDSHGKVETTLLN